MALTLTNNVSALNAQNNLSSTSSNLSRSLERLSSGLKVNRGADGPAALVISERQRAQITGLKTAIDNTNKAVSLVQTGEGALNEINSLLNKARSLALDSANGGVNDTNAYQANQAELTNILGTIDKISGSTEFNGKKLLDGTGGSNSLSTATAGVNLSGNATGAINTNLTYAFTVDTAATRAQTSGTFATIGAGNAGDIVISNGSKSATVTLAEGDTLDVAVGKINEGLTAAGITNVKASNGFNGANGGDLFLTSSDFTADITVGGTTATLGDAGLAAGTYSNTDAQVSYTDSNGNSVQTTGVGNSVSLSGELAGIQVSLGQDPGVALDSVSSAFSGTAGQGFVFQIGANAGQTASIDFQKTSTDTIGNVGANFLKNADVTSASNAQTAITIIDKAISDVTNFRGRLGAFQSNTLQTTANNLRNALENTTAAESIIRDTDFASEIANFTKYQTQLQAGSTVLGNANQMTQLVASLLRG